MTTRTSVPPEKIGEDPGPAEPGHEAWVRQKVEAALKEAETPGNRIPADQAWRDLALEP